MREDPVTTLTFMLLIFLPAFHQGDVHWGRGIRPFRDYWTELTLIPRPNVTVGPQAEQGLMEVVWSFSSTVGPFPRHSVQADGAGRALLLGPPVGCCPPSSTFVFPGPSSQEEAGLPKPVHSHTPQRPSPLPSLLGCKSSIQFSTLYPPHPETESSETACFPSPRLCLYSRCFLRLVFVFGSLLWSCMVPVFSTNIHCPLVKPFFSTSAPNSQGNEQKSVGGLIHQSWGKRGFLRGVGC